MKIFKFFSTVCLFSIVFMSCDKVEFPRNEGVIVPPLESRRVLIVDFTGHTCANCPPAAVVAQEIHDVFPDHVKILGVHPDILGLSTPQVGQPDDRFSTDWRTEEGTHYQNMYGDGLTDGIPAGMVSAVSSNSSYIFTSTQWRGLVEGLIFEERAISIDSLQIEYDDATRTISLGGSLEFETSLEGNYNLILATVETNIIDWQKNGSGTNLGDPAYPVGDVPNYKHKHVLRNHINGLQGELVTGGTNEGNVYSFSSSSILDEDFVAEEVSVYAYVYNTETLEILDVVERHIIE